MAVYTGVPEAIDEGVRTSILRLIVVATPCLLHTDTNDTLDVLLGVA